jgi:hypothetical protein
MLSGPMAEQADSAVKQSKIHVVADKRGMSPSSDPISYHFSGLANTVTL